MRCESKACNDIKYDGTTETLEAMVKQTLGLATLETKHT